MNFKSGDLVIHKGLMGVVQGTFDGKLYIIQENNTVVKSPSLVGVVLKTSNYGSARFCKENNIGKRRK